VRSYVLDTHGCIFMLASPKKLGAAARAAILAVEAGRAQAWLPAAAVAEVVLLRSLGRTDVGLPELHRAFRACPRFRFLPLDLAQLDEFAALGAIRDPFDRLVVAAARQQDARLITRDGTISDAGLVDTVWG